MTPTSDMTDQRRLADDLLPDCGPGSRPNASWEPRMGTWWPQVGDRDFPPVAGATRRIQRREFKDYQPLFMLLNGLDIIDEATRREFICIQGPVWQRYTEATKGAKARRITVLFLSNENNGFDELLVVACSSFRRRQHHTKCLWNQHPLAHGLDDAGLRHICHDLSGRSVVTWQAVQPWLSPQTSPALSMRQGPVDVTHCVGPPN